MAFPLGPAMRRGVTLAAAVLLSLPGFARAKLTLPALFSDHLVLQQGQPDLVWGWDDPGATVEVTLGAQRKTATADSSGKWTVQLDAMPASATPLTLTAKGTSTVEVKDILVGEVWMCSGQSNMAFPLHEALNAEVEAASMNHPQIRLLTVPSLGTQKAQHSFAGAWAVCTPDTARDFSAIGLYYGRYLHQVLGVPVGIICNAWGGSYLEAWLPREVMERDARFADLMEQTRKAEARAASPKAIARYEQQLADWEKEAEEAAKQNLPRPHHPKDPRDFLTSNGRPANAYQGILAGTRGYGIKGVLWYQGESNTPTASLYEKLFPLLIEQWRKDWSNAELPFYWVQLPNHGERIAEPTDGAWPMLRDAQTKALQLPHTGQAVTIDIGEGDNLHPKNKLDVAARLARWALVKDYGKQMAFRSPGLRGSSRREDGKITLTFDFVGRGLCTHGQDDVMGFALCGEDRKWQWAHGAITGPDTVEVWAEKVPKPIAVRYAWSDNPACNLFTAEGLPATPFRTDDFEVVLPEKTAPAPPAPAPARSAAAK